MQALDEQGLLQDVCQHSEEDGPRLVYADWFEDNGQPERAEFIRAQVELAGLAPVEYMSESELCFHDDPQQSCYQCRGLRDHAKKLLIWDWERPLWLLCGHREKNLGGPPFAGFLWQRGFVATAILTCADWMKYGKGLVKAAPLMEVRLSDKQPIAGHQGEPDGPLRWGFFAPDVGEEGSSLPPGLWEAIQPKYKPVPVRPWEEIELSTGHETAELANAALSQACLKWARATV